MFRLYKTRKERCLIVMRIYKYELKKLFLSRLTLGVLILALLTDIFMILFGYGGIISWLSYKDDHLLERDSVHAIAGAASDETVENIDKQMEEFSLRPENMLTDEQVEQAAQKALDEFIDNYKQGFYPDMTEEEYSERADISFFIDRYNDPYERMTAAARESYEWQSMIEQRNAVVTALSERKAVINTFNEKISDTDGAVKARLEKLYADFLAHEYVTDYDKGWEYFLSTAHDTLAPLLGMVIIIGISSLFAIERIRHTDSLILSSRYGKSRAVIAKVLAGFTYTAVMWLLFELVNAVMIFSVYGSYGANSAYGMLSLPYYMTNLQMTFCHLGISLLAALYLCGIVMFISTLSKSRIAAFVIGAVLLIQPFIMLLGEVEPIRVVSVLMPGGMLTGSAGSGGFANLYDIFGFIMTDDLAIILIAAAIFLITSTLSFVVFRRWQVKN